MGTEFWFWFTFTEYWLCIGNSVVKVLILDKAVKFQIFALFPLEQEFDLALLKKWLNTKLQSLAAAPQIHKYCSSGSTHIFATCHVEILSLINVKKKYEINKALWPVLRFFYFFKFKMIIFQNSILS